MKLKTAITLKVKKNNRPENSTVYADDLSLTGKQ
jgi:hypothetical protein